MDRRMDTPIDRRINGHIWDSRARRFQPGEITWNREGVIDGVRPRASVERQWIVPGFLDQHVHGAGGADTMDGSHQRLATMAAELAKYGVTGFLATTLTASPEALLAAVSAAGDYVSERGAELLGLHLEGPYLDPEHRGAQPPAWIRAADRGELERLIDRAQGRIRLVTVAPERPGALETIAWLTAAAIRVNMGHSGADFEAAQRGADAGADGVTHLFNGMPSLHHRAPGLVGLALSDPRIRVEVIADGVHLHPAVVGMVWSAAQGRVIAVTDGISAVGLGPGRHRLGELEVEVDERAVRLPSGTLAGSKLTLAQAYRNLLEWNVDEADVIDSLSTLVAERFGWDDRGRLAPGCRADAVVLDADRTILKTLRAGRLIYHRGNPPTQACEEA